MILSAAFDPETGRLTLVVQATAATPSSTGAMLLCGGTGGFRDIPGVHVEGLGQMRANVMLGFKNPDAPAKAPKPTPAPLVAPAGGPANGNSPTTSVANGPAGGMPFFGKPATKR